MGITDPSVGANDPERNPIDPPRSLRLLPHAAGRIWTDAEERRRALVAIAQALDRTDAASLQVAIRHVDDAVVAGLRALGFPRGPIQRVAIERSRMTWAGRKDPACTLWLSADALRRNLRLDRPDAVFRTWVHESLHARQPFAAGYTPEYRRSPGYEEGLVEGLSCGLLQVAGGFAAIGGSFDYYVAAWRILGELLLTPAYAVWERLWREPPGRVRAQFASVVDDLLQLQGKPAVAINGMARLQGIADTLFSPTRASAVPDSAMIERTWKLVLP
jgi:hypothetical protein